MNVVFYFYQLLFFEVLVEKFNRFANSFFHTIICVVVVVIRLAVLTGAEFDLRHLTKSTKEPSYYIKDGDIPCTPEIEPTFSYVWNFCGQVTPESFPSVCDKSSQQAAALQYVNRADGYQECDVIGHYDQYNDDLYYSLIDVSDPSKGVSMKYPDGEKCPSDKRRSVTLDVMCANTEMEIISALEPTICEYHIVLKSYRGCPTV